MLINGFSKAFAMTGWRVGFVCAPKEIDEAMFKIHQYTILCAPHMSQRAAVCALKDGFSVQGQILRKDRGDQGAELCWREGPDVQCQMG